MTEKVEQDNDKPEETLEEFVGRMMGPEIARLEAIKDDPVKGLAARLAIDLLRPFYSFLVAETRKGASAQKLASAIGQFFGNATFLFAANTTQPPIVAKATADAMIAKIGSRFGAEKPQGSGIVTPRRRVILPGVPQPPTKEQLSRMRGE